jgi:glycosyltransferase involved in cell wall biosynthesis
MKIGLITSAIDGNRAGIAMYIYNLVSNLTVIDKANEYTLVHHYKTQDDIYQANRELIIPYPKIPLQKTIGENLFLPLKLRKYDFDIVHELSQKSSFVVNLSAKRILTIHDLTPLLFPQTHSKFVVFLHRYLLPRASKNADKIIAASVNTKRDIIKHLKVPEDKIEVIYYGRDERFIVLSEKEVEEARAKYDLPQRYILSVCTLEPRKNMPTLIKAYHKLRGKGIEHKLVVVGAKGWKYSRIFQTVRELGLENDITFLGYVSNQDLPGIYNLADLFVFPSLYEGFGLPPLEAMACGCPVITSNTSSLPEVVGDAAIMTDPYNVDEIANAMYEVLTNQALRKEMLEKGLNRAKTFSWDKAARETMKVYNETCGRTLG